MMFLLAKFKSMQMIYLKSAKMKKEFLNIFSQLANFKFTLFFFFLYNFLF